MKRIIGRLGSGRVRSRALGGVLGALLGILAVTPPARAAGPAARPPVDPNAARAIDLFNSGKVAADQGDYAGACPRFAESAHLDPRVGTLARLADCEEKLGHLVLARVHWEQARDLAMRTHDARAEHARREYTRIDALTPKLRLSFDGQPPADFAATIDNDKVDASELGVPIPVEPGAHAVHATATGKVPFSSTVVTATDGAVTSVAIALPDAPVGPAAPARLPSQDHHEVVPEGPQWSGRKSAAIAVGALGVAGIGVGSVFGALAFPEWKKAVSTCGRGCPSSGTAESQKATASTFATVSDVGFAVGAAALVGAGILWFTAGRGQTSSSASVQVIPSVGPNAVGLFVTGPLRF